MVLLGLPAAFLSLSEGLTFLIPSILCYLIQLLLKKHRTRKCPEVAYVRGDEVDGNDKKKKRRGNSFVNFELNVMVYEALLSINAC